MARDTRQKMVIITNGIEEREVTEKVAKDTMSLNAHGWYVKESVKPIATTKAPTMPEAPATEEFGNQEQTDEGMTDVFNEPAPEEKAKPGRKKKEEGK